MFCQIHNKTILGVCSICRKFLCQVCFLDSHLSHPQSITFLKNLLLISRNTCQQLIKLKGSFDEYMIFSSIIPDFIDQQRKEINRRTLQLLEQQNYDDEYLEFIISIVQKHVFKEVQQLLNQIHYEQLYDDNQKQHLNQAILELLSKDDPIYIRIKQYDMYYFLQKISESSKAQSAYRIIFQTLIKRPLFFFNFLSKFQYQENFSIDTDNHFSILLARNFYYIKKYSVCIELLNNDNFNRNEEALIYKSLSFLRLQQYSDAENAMKKLLMITTNHSFCLFLQSIILEGLVKIEQLVQISYILYENNQDSFFQRQLYHVLFVTQKYNEIYQNINKTLQSKPNDYNALQYKAIACFQLNRYKEVQNLFETLIQLEPKKISGYILKGGFLLVQQNINELTELSNYFYQNFNNQPISQLFQSFLLYQKLKFADSFDHFEQTQQNIMTQKQNRLNFDIMFLVKSQKVEKAYQRLMNNYENSKQFYFNATDFCFEVHQSGLSWQALSAVEKLSANIETEAAKKLYPFVQGKLLLDQGISRLNLNNIEKSLTLFNSGKFDSFGLPYIDYFKGQALSYLSKIEEATIHLEKAYQNKQHFQSIPVDLFIILGVNQILQNKFDQALKYLKDDPYIQKNYQNLIIGLCLWIKGSLKDAYELLETVVQFFTQVNIIIIWILKEQNQLQKAENLFQNIAIYFPAYQFFLQKDCFMIYGHCEKYMKNNWHQFQNLDNRKFYAIKFLCYFIDSIGYPLPDKLYNVKLGNTLVCELECQIYSQIEKKKQELITNYPFI